MLESRSSFFGPVFLEETENDTGQDNGQNNPGIQVLAQQERNHGGDDEDDHEQVQELPDEDKHRRYFFPRRQFVGAMAFQTGLSLILG